MPQTIISSKTKEIIIDPDQPFVIIGERINPTNIIDNPTKRILLVRPFLKLRIGNLEKRTGLISKKLIITTINNANLGSPILPYI